MFYIVPVVILHCMLSSSMESAEAYEYDSNRRCGCSYLKEDDTSYISPWQTYKHRDFPFLCRAMQRKKFVATCVILNEFWVLTCSALFQDEKDIEVIVDQSLVDKRKARAVELVFPHSGKGICKFVLIRLATSLNPPGCPENDTVCGVCLPKPGAHYYGPVILPYYMAPAGYCDAFSTTCFILRRVNLDCCYHESERCEQDGRVCSSDLGRENDNLGCKGAVGAPLVVRVRNKFVLVAIMCDVLGCELQHPCTTMDEISHYVDFIRETINEPATIP